MIAARPESRVTTSGTGGYQPTARRPIATRFRRTADRSVRACVRLGIHADVVSCASIVAAAGAGACFWWSGSTPGVLVPAVLLCYVRLWLNMVDGMVALAAGTASARGEIFNEGPDRVADILIFVGVAHSGLCHPLSGYWATILALLTAYVGMLGQAVGARRQFGGVMSKPWRMVALHIGAWLTLIQLWRGSPTAWAGLSLLDWTCVAIVAGCVETIAVRLVRIFGELPADARIRGEAAQKA
jgi:phosphatidylglycerophosphate synthase